MNLSELLSSEERTRILKDVICLDGPIIASPIARKLKISKSLLSVYLKILENNRIIVRKDGKVFIDDNVYVRALKVLLVLNGFDTALFSKYKFIKGIGLYGSCARGENTKDSDIDIWVRIEKTPELKLAGFLKEMKAQNENFKILFLTDEKINALRESDNVFFNSLIFGSILIYGENLEA